MNLRSTNRPPDLLANGLPHHETLHTRREALLRGGGGFGALALSYLLGHSGARAAQSLDGKVTHAASNARSVIFLFMEGGPSHLDTFDRKPLVNKLAGKKLPPSFAEGLITAMGEVDSPILASKREWKRYGESGIEVSNWYPKVAERIDDIAVIRSVVSEGINHANGVSMMNTGWVRAGRPSLGAWVTYGLGTENQDLPAFVVMKDTDKQVVGGPRNWGAGFMPALYQGTEILPGDEPIPNLHTPRSVGDRRQRAKLDLIREINAGFNQRYADNTELEARIKNYELAFRMQAEAPEAIDLSREPEHIKELYGMDREETEPFGRNCLLARRLVERGVRFVQLYSGSGSKWDAHSGIEKNHDKYCGETDTPIAGLLTDLKQRGLLDETLVIWGGEFGRTPMSEKGDGRDHNPTGFTMWMAGGGVQGGQVIGETDELGLRAVKDKVHIHDLHSTVLHLMGLDHTELVYMHKGRPERADLNEGHVVHEIAGA